jgi:hypothetical protein
MKKYVVPAMKLHQLKAGSMICVSDEVPAKPGWEDESGANTESYEVDREFNSGSYFN